MSALPLTRITKISSLKKLAFISSRSYAGYWNRDWRPSKKIPQTPEERKAAAKKYGMIPEDYETYTEEETKGLGYGDYPKLPIIPAEQRDPYAIYDMPELKRNFGEPVNVDFDMYGEDRWNYGQRRMFTTKEALVWFLSVVGFFSFMVLVFDKHVEMRMRKIVPKKCYKEGEKQYLFEPVQ